MHKNNSYTESFAVTSNAQKHYISRERQVVPLAHACGRPWKWPAVVQVCNLSVTSRTC